VEFRLTATHPRRLLDDCFLHDKERWKHADAIACFKDRVVPVAGTEIIPIADAVGRCIAGAITASAPVPAHTNSAVDGYAFSSRDYDPQSGTTLALAGRAAAGHPLDQPSASGTAIRIFTGAVMPVGCDTVVMQEDVRTDGERVTVPAGLKPGANVRKAGEDVALGDDLFQTGQIVRPQDLAALASIGAASISCFRRLSVAVVSSGDEVIRVGSGPLTHGQVYDANAPMLGGLISAAGATFVDAGVVPDDPARIQATLLQLARDHNVILTTGGASRGDEDHLVTALDAVGKRHLWQLAVKPGRPMSFGQIGDCVVVGLPGNPVAVFVCFLMYVWPLLRRLGGAEWPEPRRYRMRAAFTFKGRKPGRREFWRGILVDTDNGLKVDKFKRDGSGLISGLRAADGLIEISEEHGDVQPDDWIDFILFSEFGIPGR
jgi:molybdopterin molybdotransferase